MGLGDASNTNNPGLHLVLGLGLSSNSKGDDNIIRPSKSSSDEPSLTLGLCGGETYQVPNNTNRGSVEFCGQSSPAVSSFSSGRVVKRERDQSSEEVEAADRVSSRVSDEDEDATNARKKLRLTKDQSALLEESFKQHSTLNPKQKQGLARQLNLRPRQVEVWFQNRRARTKLKQTEVDCELLKKWCETLRDENRRLQKEVSELKAMKVAQTQPLYMAATLSMCPSCERLADAASNKTTFSMPPNPHFYAPFSNPSAAC